MNEQIAQLQDSDPEFARTLKRLRAASYGLAAAIVLAAGLGLWAVVVNSQQATEITKIQKTPCTLDPEGKACSAIKERLARDGSLKSPCIEHQRVEGTKGRNCPQFYVVPSRRQPPADSREAQNLEQGAIGDDASTTNTEGRPEDKSGGVKAGQGQETPGGGTTKPSRPPKHHHSKSPTPSQTAPAPPPAEEPAPPTTPPSEPGNSGGGASAEHGLDVCVELAVSACVKSDVELPTHLP